MRRRPAISPRSITTLRDQITQLERRRDELVANHPDAPLFASFPGAGLATVPRLIAAFGTRRERYQSAFEVECDSGIAPVHIRSGKIDRVSFRHACQDFTRQTFHEFAGQTIPQCEWAKAFYRAHCQKPEQHHAAVRALAFKWIRILFRCWKDRKPYDEQLYLTSLRRRSGLLGSGPLLLSLPSGGRTSPASANFRRKKLDTPPQKAPR